MIEGGMSIFQYELLHLQRHMPPIKRCSFVLGNLSQGNVVIGERADLRRSGGREIALEAQYFETGALAAFEFLLFGIEGGFGIDPGFAGGIHSLEAGPRRGDRILYLYQNILFKL